MSVKRSAIFPVVFVCIIFSTIVAHAEDSISFQAAVAFDTGDSPRSVTICDLNGDGYEDLIVANDSDDTVSILINTTDSDDSSGCFITAGAH